MPLYTGREEFARVWAEEGGSGTKVAARLGMSEVAVFQRRRRMERDGYQMPGNTDCPNPGGFGKRAYPREAVANVREGLIVAFGDLHSLPLKMRRGDTPAMRLLLEFLEQHGSEVRLLLCMGDTLDGSSISRHPPLGWEEKPAVIDEIGGAVHDLDRIQAAAPKAERLYVVGNHDERYDRTLAMRAREFQELNGFRLQDQFQRWPMSWKVRINSDIIALHRWHGGVHAPHNNIMKSGGAHVITGDTHRLKVYPYSGQMGPLYGVETGTLADPFGPQFDYTRGVDPNWQPGFAVLPVVGGELHRPYTVSVDDVPRPRYRVKARSSKA